MESTENNSCIQSIKIKYNKFKIKCGTYYDNLKPYIRLSLEFTKIIIGCLLFIFVPQICKGPDETVQNLIHEFNITTTLDEIRRQCTLQDNFFDVNDYKIFVITWNFLTLIIFLTNFCWEIKRERYIQSHFEYTIRKPITDIKNVFETNNNLDRSYHNKTKILYYLNYSCLFMIITNILFTSIMIYKYYYDGFRSVTGLITCVILIFQKIYYNYDTLNISLKEGYVLSTSLTKPHDYNTLEPIKFKQNEYIKKENRNKSYRIYYLGKQKEDDIEGDKFVMQTNNYEGFIPIFIETNSKNRFNKLARKKIKKEIKNEIRRHNIEIKNKKMNQSEKIDDMSYYLMKKRRVIDIKRKLSDDNLNNLNNLEDSNIKNQLNMRINNPVSSDSLNDFIINLEQCTLNNKHDIETEIPSEEINHILESRTNVINKIKLKNTKIQDHIKEKINERKDLMNEIKNKNITLQNISEITENIENNNITDTLV